MWGNSTWPTPERSTWTIPWGISRLERKTFLQSESWLGLKRANGRPLHAWLYQQDTNQLPTWYPYTSTALAIQVYHHSMWRQGPTRRRTRNLRPSHQISNQTCPRHCRHTNILRTSCRTNHSHLSQWNFILSSQWNRRSPQHMPTTPWLHSNSYSRWHPIPCKWHDTFTQHWCILPLWTQWQNPSWCIHVLHQPDFRNRAIIILSGIIKHVMSSVSEAEIGALYYVWKRVIPIWTNLEELGHSQDGPAQVITDYSNAHVITLDTMVSKASNYNDMHLRWLKFCGSQQLFSFLWARGSNNRSKYPRKHHAPQHHTHVRSRYVVSGKINSVITEWDKYTYQVKFSQCGMQDFFLNLIFFTFTIFNFFVLITRNVKADLLARVC